MIFAKRTATPKHVALTLSILSLLAGSVYSVAVPNEFGYVMNGCGWRYKDPDVQNGCGSLSLMGGAQVFVHGNGFDEMPQNNLIDFLNSQFGGDKIHAGNFLSDEDEFSSAPALGKIAYTTPSLMDMFPGTTYESFNGATMPLSAWQDTTMSYLNFFVQVTNSQEKGGPILCSNNAKCQFRYVRHYTPILNDIIPSQVFKGQLTGFVVNPKSAVIAALLQPDGTPMHEMRIGQTLLDWEFSHDATSTSNANQNNFWYGTVGDQFPSTNDDVTLNFLVGNAYNTPRSMHCNFAGDECWRIRTHPVIDSISAASGFTSGGQELLISGSGLNATNELTEVEVDGVACEVKRATYDTITCTTGAAGAPSVDGNDMPGQFGLKWEKIDPVDPDEQVSWITLTDGSVPVTNTSLYTSFEAYPNVQFSDFGNTVNFGQIFKGWFRAPATTNYRFYISCDDYCKLLLDQTAYNSASPVTPAPAEIAKRNYYTNWRAYFQELDGVNTHKSDWIALTEGEFYYVEGQMINGGSNHHFTVSVEVEAADVADHPQAGHEVQKLAIDQTQIPEEWTFTIASSSGGSYQINIMSPTGVLWKSGYISDNASAGAFRWAIYNYFQTKIESNIEVTRDMLDVNGDVTLITADMVAYRYDITLLRRIEGYSFNQISVTKIDSTATFTIVTPQQNIQSSAPLRGSYTVSCTDSDSVVWTTTPRLYNEWNFGLKEAITAYIPFLADKVDIDYCGTCNYYDNCICWIVKFLSVQGDIPQCTIQSAVEDLGATPIVNALTGADPVYSSTTLVEGGTNLMFEPIPLEMIRTPVTSPQVMVKVNGLDAMCPKFNCDYLYADAASQVTDNSLSGLVLTITGTSLPTTGAETIKIQLAGVDCGSISLVSSTEITCTLEHSPPAGSHIVKVRTVDGIIPNSATALTVNLVATSVTPTVLNFLGGDILTIVGTGFDANQKANNAVSFGTDGNICKIKTVTSVQITCETTPFPTRATTGQNLIVSIEANSNDMRRRLAVTSSGLTVTQVASVEIAVTASPTSMSPVLKTDLTITLGPGYTGTDATDSLVVDLIDSLGDRVKSLYVMNVDIVSDPKTFTVKFNGAISGDYTLQIANTDPTIGRLDTSAILLTVESTVTSIEPRTGSSLGGTVLTITGTNFSNDPLDNPVKVGSNYCFVITTSPTEITCRIEAKEHVVGEAEILVFLKTSEEAVCDTGDSCMFTYSTPVADVSSLVTSIDSVNEVALVTLTGTGFTADDLTVELWIDGFQQTTVSATTTTIVFEVTEILARTSSDVMLIFADGNPSGVYSPITFTPGYFELTPHVSSLGGGKLFVRGSGFGENDTILGMWALSQNMCTSVEILGYGEFICTTKIGVSVAATTTWQIYYENNLKASCSMTDVTLCRTSQVIADSPQFTAAVLDDANSMTFTGTFFPTSGHTAVVNFGGVDSDSAVITSDTSVTATWTAGMPVAPVAAKPLLKFLSDSDETELWAHNTNAVTLSVPLTLGASTSVVCSFAGGCDYTIAAAGLTTALVNAENYIEVCGNTCVIDTVTSDASTLHCSLPLIVTSYGVDNLAIAESSVLEGTWFSTASATERAKLSDYNNLVDYKDTTASGCNFGMEFKPGYVAVLDEAKFFLARLLDKTPYVDQFKLQGSNDNFVTSETLWTADKTILEGWNYIRFDTTKPAYNKYRFFGAVAGSCRVGEARFTGLEAIADDTNQHICTPSIWISGSETVTADTVTYQAAITPVLTAISPRFGSVLGGTVVTLTGTGFDVDPNNVSVLFDDRVCTVTASTATEITCTTDDKPYIPDEPRVQITIAGSGSAATGGLVFRYVSLWSRPETWGNDIPPLEGESVSVPKGQHLLVDVNTPVLNAVIVEGSLIFAPNDADPTELRTFDAHMVMVNGGYFEAGTEEFPYTSKLQITMYSTVDSPYLPIYGNKVIGVRFGQIEMHGVPRLTTWTQLSTTADIGATSITLNNLVADGEVDWAVGEWIAIAPTGFDPREAEKRQITAVDTTGTNYVLSFDEPLLYKHYAGHQTFGATDVFMAAEVGLLTRNIVYRGDPTDSAINKYGAHIMIHSPGDESCIGRIEYVELTDVGQAFKLGRYPLHFHMIGTVHQSYVRGNAIHQTYNRAVTIHGVHYFRIINNVAFDTMGHTFFIEDAAETKNFLDHNLAIQVKRSWSLLNTDQTPAGFWITHPDNIFRNNHVGGSDRYGFWYDTQNHAMGPSTDLNVCPPGTKIGEFENNQAHSVGRYGLRIFHNLIPRTYPCEPMTYDPTNIANPYWQNPPIPAIFNNFLGWKCGRNGAIAERVGAVVFNNFITADNILAGIEYSLSEDIEDGWAKVTNALLIGRTENTEFLLDSGSPHGIIGPRTENFSIFNAIFHNYDWNDAAALGTCSHCFHPAATDSGARTVTVSGLEFNSVDRKIRYQYPWRAIFHDLDGSLTGLGANTWASANMQHNYQPECQFDATTLDVMDGVICDSSVQIRRVAFWDMGALVRMLSMKAMIFDDSIINAMTPTDLTTYLEDINNYNFMFQKDRLKPSESWAIPWVTGHKYKIHWQNGIDFTGMKVEVSPRWEVTDLSVNFVHNFTDIREAINITTQYGAGIQLANLSLQDTAEPDLLSGMNNVWNDTATRHLEFVINGRDPTYSQLQFTAVRCLSCGKVIEDVPLSDFVYWSSPDSWVSGVLPVDGEDVEILPGVWMIYDLNVDEAPTLNNLEINGRLQFLNNDVAAAIDAYWENKDLTLIAHKIFVRAGEFLIGTKEEPFEMQAEVILRGMRNDEGVFMPGNVEVGNKVLVNSGSIQWFGKPRSRVSRLKASVQPSFSNSAPQKTLIVDTGLDWQAGEEIYLAPTAMQHNHSDYGVIESYSPESGILTLVDTIKYYHFGDLFSTAKTYKGHCDGVECDGLDMRGEVVLLNRNIKVIGYDEDGWGGSVLTTDILDSDVVREGELIWDNVQMYNCSQNNVNAAIRFEQAMGKQTSHITNSVLHNGLHWGIYIKDSQHINVETTSVVGFRAIGIHVLSVRNVTLNENYVLGIFSRTGELALADMVVDIEACFTICATVPGNKCYDLHITRNIAGGCVYAGFVVPAHECGVENDSFRNNIAHSSTRVGAHIFPSWASSGQSKCFEGSYFSAYKCKDGGAQAMYKSLQVRYKHMTMVDNAAGFNIQTGLSGDWLLAHAEDIHMYGESDAKDCPHPSLNCFCEIKFGFMLSGGNFNDKKPHILMASGLPAYKVKSESAWGASFEGVDISFYNFDAATKCGEEQFAIHTNHYGSDYVPRHMFKRTYFVNVADAAFAHFDFPDQKWAVVDDCGEFPCTAPSNIVLDFQNTYIDGGSFSSPPNFQVVSNLPDKIIGFDGDVIFTGMKAAETYTACVEKTAWNAWRCENRQIGVLLIDSLNGDTYDRSIQPIKVTSDDGYYNVINSMMDHVWDGFYTGQVRLSRFPIQVETGKDYTIRMTGTPPGNMRYKLDATVGQMKLLIPYPNAGAYAVYVNDKEIEYTPWDPKIGRHGALTKAKGCGENRFVGIENYLEFMITPNCTVRVIPKDSIMTSVRLDWTLEGFYAAGGVVSFTDRVAGALGIHASQIKTVAVYQGSVVVDFFIEAPGDDEEENKTWLEKMSDKLRNAIIKGLIDFGAPVLDAMSDGTIIVQSESGFFTKQKNPRPRVEVSGGKFSTLFDSQEAAWKSLIPTNADGTLSEADIAASDMEVVEGTYYSIVADISMKTFKYPLILLAGIIAIVVGIVMICCTKCCGMRNKQKLVQEKMREIKQHAVATEHEDHQFHPDENEVDMDIFAPATPKALQKGRQDDVVNGSSPRQGLSSTQKL